MDVWHIFKYEVGIQILKCNSIVAWTKSLYYIHECQFYILCQESEENDRDGGTITRECVRKFSRAR